MGISCSNECAVEIPVFGRLTARGERQIAANRSVRGESPLAARSAANRRSPLGHLLRKKYVIVRSQPLSTAVDRSWPRGDGRKRSQCRTVFDFDSVSVRRRAVSRAVWTLNTKCMSSTLSAAWLTACCENVALQYMSPKIAPKACLQLTLTAWRRCREVRSIFAQ